MEAVPRIAGERIAIGNGKIEGCLNLRGLSFGARRGSGNYFLEQNYERETSSQTNLNCS
jgi:hypothetical protein